jgi:hypothetical protein
LQVLTKFVNENGSIYIYPREIENILEKEKIREEERNDDVIVP